MNNTKKINSEVKCVYVVCVLVAEFAGFAIIRTNGSLIVAGLVGGGAALVAAVVTKLIARARGMDFYSKSHK